jgi:peptidoglycan/LPS O-acetylase OafA/YrhL
MGILFLFTLNRLFTVHVGKSKTNSTFTHGWVLLAGGILCASSLLSGASANVTNGEFLFTVTTNLTALILAAIIICVGLIEERRLAFWLGSLYLVLLILSRFLEYETSLLVKSAAFLACGVTVIIAGISYEKYLRHKAAGIEAGQEGLAYE